MSDFDSGNSVNCVLLDVDLYETKRENNWSPVPEGQGGIQTLFSILSQYKYSSPINQNKNKQEGKFNRVC